MVEKRDFMGRWVPWIIAAKITSDRKSARGWAIVESEIVVYAVSYSLMIANCA